MLADFFLRKYCDRYRKPGLKLESKALDALLHHGWPGNIRELEHTMEKGVILSDSKVILPGHLFPESSAPPSLSPGTSLNLEEHERMVISRALKAARGNVSSAAKKLGINRSTLYQKMKKYGL